MIPATRFPASPKRSCLFLGIVYVLLELFLWYVAPSRNSIAIAAGAILILIVMIGDPIRRGETWTSLGLGFTNFSRAARIVLPVTIAAAIGLWGLNRILPGAPDPGLARFGKLFLNILPWALLQQGMLQATFNRRLSAAMSPGMGSVLIMGVAFAGMHVPNPLLIGLTFVAGTLWARSYQRTPNLTILVISHAILSAAAQACLPTAWTHGFRVGPGYFRWHP